MNARRPDLIPDVDLVVEPGDGAVRSRGPVYRDSRLPKELAEMRGKWEYDATPGIGRDLAEKIAELIGTDPLKSLEALRRKVAPQTRQLSIASDAHSAHQLAHLDGAVRQARRGWASKRDALDTRPAAEVRAMLRS